MESKKRLRVFLIGYFISLLIVVIFFLGCTPYRYLDKHHEDICNKCIDEYGKASNKDTTLVLIDTMVIQGNGEVNDIYQTLLFECDSAGQVQLKNIGTATDSLNFYKNSFTRMLTAYKFANGKLHVNNKVYNDSIRSLLKVIETNKSPIIITRPAEIVYRVPIEIYVVLGILTLALIALTILIFKK